MFGSALVCCIVVSVALDVTIESDVDADEAENSGPNPWWSVPVGVHRQD